MCIFCKIINKELESNIVFEDEMIIGILDHDPINEGHVLILPKVHVDSIDKLSEKMVIEIMKMSQKIVKALESIFHADGYSLMQNGGKFCDFGHCHVHIFPRYENDGFGWKYPEGEFDCSEEVTEKIKRELSVD